jgi:hypothetical protein
MEDPVLKIRLNIFIRSSLIFSDFDPRVRDTYIRTVHVWNFFSKDPSARLMDPRFVLASSWLIRDDAGIGTPQCMNDGWSAREQVIFALHVCVLSLMSTYCITFEGGSGRAMNDLLILMSDFLQIRVYSTRILLLILCRFIGR